MKPFNLLKAIENPALIDWPYGGSIKKVIYIQEAHRNCNTILIDNMGIPHIYGDAGLKYNCSNEDKPLQMKAEKIKYYFISWPSNESDIRKTSKMYKYLSILQKEYKYTIEEGPETIVHEIEIEE